MIAYIPFLGIPVGVLIVYWVLCQEREYTHLYTTGKRLHTSKTIQLREMKLPLIIRIRTAKALGVLFITLFVIGILNYCI